MPDYIANPDDLETPESVALSPVRRGKGGSNGLHPLATVPPQGGPERAACTVLCAFCGTPVLHGVTASGQRLALDLTRRTWVVTWDSRSELPRLVHSRGYVEHCCQHKEPV